MINSIAYTLVERTAPICATHMWLPPSTCAHITLCRRYVHPIYSCSKQTPLEDFDEMFSTFNMSVYPDLTLVVVLERSTPHYEERNKQKSTG